MLFDNLDLTPYEAKLAAGTLNKQTGTLRSSRPSVPTKTKTVDNPGSDIFPTMKVYQNEAEVLKGETAYVWRMLAFYLGIDSHMPVTAYFWLNGSVSDQDKRAKELDQLVDKLLAAFPKNEQLGTIRWGKALGYIG